MRWRQQNVVKHVFGHVEVQPRLTSRHMASVWLYRPANSLTSPLDVHLRWFQRPQISTNFRYLCLIPESSRAADIPDVCLRIWCRLPGFMFYSVEQWIAWVLQKACLTLCLLPPASAGCWRPAENVTSVWRCHTNLGYISVSVLSMTSRRSGFQKCSFHHQRPGKYRKQKEAKENGLFSFLTGWRHTLLENSGLRWILVLM